MAQGLKVVGGVPRWTELDAWCFDQPYDDVLLTDNVQYNVAGGSVNLWDAAVKDGYMRAMIIVPADASVGQEARLRVTMPAPAGGIREVYAVVNASLDVEIWLTPTHPGVQPPDPPELVGTIARGKRVTFEAGPYGGAASVVVGVCADNSAVVYAGIGLLSGGYANTPAVASTTFDTTFAELHTKLRP